MDRLNELKRRFQATQSPQVAVAIVTAMLRGSSSTIPSVFVGGIPVFGTIIRLSKPWVVDIGRYQKPEIVKFPAGAVFVMDGVKINSANSTVRLRVRNAMTQRSDGAPIPSKINVQATVFNQIIADFEDDKRYPNVRPRLEYDDPRPHFREGEFDEDFKSKTIASVFDYSVARHVAIATQYHSRAPHRWVNGWTACVKDHPTIADLIKLTEGEVMSLSGFGRKAMSDLKAHLEFNGLTLHNDGKRGSKVINKELKNSISWSLRVGENGPWLEPPLLERFRKAT